MNPFRKAALFNNIKFFEKFVRDCAENKYALNRVIDIKEGMSALLLVTSYAKLKLAKLLLEAGADALKRDKYDRTQLVVAIQAGCEDLLDLSLQYAGDLNYKCKDYSPLAVATSLGSNKAVEKMVKMGADPHFIIAGSGKNALHISYLAGNHKLVQFFLDLKVDQELKDSYGRKPKEYDITLIKNKSKDGE